MQLPCPAADPYSPQNKLGLLAQEELSRKAKEKYRLLQQAAKNKVSSNIVSFPANRKIEKEEGGGTSGPPDTCFQDTAEKER